MAELTQASLDKALADLYQQFDRKIDEQTTDLKAFAEAQTEELARILATTVAEPMEQRFTELEKLLELRLRVDTLETDITRKFRQIEKLLQISLNDL